MNNENIVQKLWTLCNILRGDGISYHEYISELTYLLFLKIAEETETEDLLPSGYRWDDLVGYKGDNLLFHYQSMLTHLGGAAASKMVQKSMSELEAALAELQGILMELGAEVAV